MDRRLRCSDCVPEMERLEIVMALGGAYQLCSSCTSGSTISLLSAIVRARHTPSSRAEEPQSESLHGDFPYKLKFEKDKEQPRDDQTDQSSIGGETRIRGVHNLRFPKTAEKEENLCEGVRAIAWIFLPVTACREVFYSSHNSSPCQQTQCFINLIMHLIHHRGSCE